MGPQYQVEITLTASSLPKQVFMTPAADGTPGKPSPILSSAVKVGNRVYVAGLLGNTPATKGDPEAQTREILARVERTLKLAGFTMNDIVDGIVYITDLSYFNAMNTAYRSVISKDFPARATVKTGLVGADGLVEIMFVASK
jgi:2-iminobutanoate/2-iminopropanoate deaminase